MKVTPQFIGRFRANPTGMPGSSSDEWQFSEDFGFLRSDNMLVIAPQSARINGASIPEFVWPILGHPMQGENKYWSAHHDCGYRGTLVVVDMSRVACGPHDALKCWQYMPVGPPASTLPRHWHDWTMREAMAVCSEPVIKRQVVYAMVYVFGRFAYCSRRKSVV